jgi:predicted nucleic acid-binding protein
LASRTGAGPFGLGEAWSGPGSVTGSHHAREEILAASRVVATVEIARTAGVALARAKAVHAGLTIDAIVMATAALLDAIVVTGDPRDFERLSVHFPRVSVLAV